ncbi:uncharacterized protein BJ212DRAFT_1318021 [Suillus subaureus]|uniref:Uncharacterized protein n=1 Tax=Suillus subaureus TaxID=48587 RepID=A0A9P7JJT4_9AGAM|nr:uncharacterized protein BJ212DRAFT_1318021 [Suillus subaureus]KAG1826093.1 hypothetical protein BJ212DRAFT_1318021 [Suillus subaureus]
MDDSPPTHTYHSPPSPVVVQLITVTAADSSGLPTKSVYHLLGDGSVVAPPLFNDLSTTYLALIIMASIFTIFARNIILSAAFLWSGRVRKKSLLYTLFLSQLLAPVSILPLLIAQFNPNFDCKLIMRITVASAGISLSLLISGILGVKAYRCLDNSRLVLVVLVALRTAAIVFLALDLASLNSFRSLAGRCYRPSNPIPYAFIILLFVESLFICLCFLYAVWKSHGSAVRGRITVSLSLDDVPDPHLDTRKESIESHKTTHSRRGWWDYVPTVDNPPFSQRSRRTQSLSRDSSIPMGGLSKFRTGERVRDPENVPSRPPIPLLPTEPPPIRTSTIHVSTTLPNTCNDVPIPRRPSSPAISSISRISRYMPRVGLFYTTFITASTVASVIMTIVGVNSSSPADHVAWMAFDWALISCLVIHSFSRVIRRHENEALLQQPSASHHTLRTDRSTAELLAEGRVRAPRSSFGRSFQVRTRRCPTNCRYDAEALRDSTTSRSLRGDPHSNALSPHPVETHPNTFLPTHPSTPEVDYFPDDISSCHRSDTKLTERVFLGHQYNDSLPSLSPRPDLDNQPSLQVNHIVT